MGLFQKEKLDERQLMIRGNTYYQALTLISTLLIINFYIKTFLEIDWAYGEWDYLLILFIGLLWIFIRFIIFDIYSITKVKYRILFIFLGFYGFGFGGYSMYLFLTNQITFIEDSKLTNQGAFLLFAGIYACMFVAFVIRQIYIKYFVKSEGEE